VGSAHHGSTAGVAVLDLRPADGADKVPDRALEDGSLAFKLVQTNRTLGNFAGEAPLLVIGRLEDLLQQALALLDLGDVTERDPGGSEEDLYHLRLPVLERHHDGSLALVILDIPVDPRVLAEQLHTLDGEPLEPVFTAQ